MDKVIRDGKVAVLYSPGFGAGWFSWHHVYELLFDPVVVEMVEKKEYHTKIENYCLEKYGDDVSIFGDKLEIAWLDVGTKFKIREYDGSESIETEESIEWLLA